MIGVHSQIGTGRTALFVALEEKVKKIYKVANVEKWVGLQV